MNFIAIEASPKPSKNNPPTKHRPTSNLLMAALLVLSSFAATLELSKVPTEPVVSELRVVPVADVVESGETPADAAPESDVLAEYISTRWKLSSSRAAEFVMTATAVAAKESVDPLLVLAVIANESSFNHMGNIGDRSVEIHPSKVNPMRSHGPMQVAGMWHPDAMPVDSHGRIRVTTTAENIAIGTRLLAEYTRREGGNIKRALLRYNGTLNDASGRYANRVLKFRTDLQRAMLES